MKSIHPNRLLLIVVFLKVTAYGFQIPRIRLRRHPDIESLSSQTRFSSSSADQEDSSSQYPTLPKVTANFSRALQQDLSVSPSSTASASASQLVSDDRAAEGSGFGFFLFKFFRALYVSLPLYEQRSHSVASTSTSKNATTATARGSSADIAHEIQAGEFSTEATQEQQARQQHQERDLSAFHESQHYLVSDSAIVAPTNNDTIPVKTPSIYAHAYSHIIQSTGDKAAAERSRGFSADERTDVHFTTPLVSFKSATSWSSKKRMWKGWSHVGGAWRGWEEDSASWNRYVDFIEAFRRDHKGSSSSATATSATATGASSSLQAAAPSTTGNSIGEEMVCTESGGCYVDTGTGVLFMSDEQLSMNSTTSASSDASSSRYNTAGPSHHKREHEESENLYANTVTERELMSSIRDIYHPKVGLF